jgi:hypothetical protein
MGTDIHLNIERRIGGVWVHAWPPVALHALPECIGQEPPLRSDNRFSLGRNYSLFDILAGLARYGDRFRPLAAPRGLPDDVSAETLRNIELNLGWEDDAHSHSWVTLHELQELDWSQKASVGGLVTGPEYLVFKNEGRPASWHVNPPLRSTRIVSNEEMEHALSSGSEADLLTRIAWKVSYRECVGSHFFDVMLPALRELGAPEDVRLVFFFDS